MTSPVAATPLASAWSSAATDSRAERCIRWSGRSSAPASERSRSTITLSAVDGYGPIPSSAETAPSCAWPPRESDGSSQWSASRRSVSALYCSARRMSPAETTGRPSSVNAAAPAPASSAISVSSSPSWPLLIAAMKPTGTTASSRAPLDERAEDRRRVDDGLRVRHREDRAVAAGRRGLRARADRLLVLAPRRAQVDVRVDEGGRDDEVARRTRLDRRDHAVRHRDPQRLVDALRRSDDAAFERERVRSAVSSDEHQATSAALARLDRRDREDVVEHRHPHDEARAHLIRHERGGRVRDARVDLDAAVHRPGMHDDLPLAYALGRDAVERRVLAQRRHERLAHALLLHPQDVDDVGVGDRTDVVRDLAAERLDAARYQRRRADEHGSRADERERLHERARDA